MKRAIITGITGQDGSYLAEHLLGEGYEVYGFIHGKADPRASRVGRLLADVRLIHGDLLEMESVQAAVEQAQPDEFYNLAAITHVPTSWEHAELSAQVTGLGVLRALEACRIYCERGGEVRFFQASSSEMFGRPGASPQSEQTPMRPVSPYGSAKLYGHFLTGTYRDLHHLYATSGILYNHESPRRRPEFLSRKVSLGVARIKLGHEHQLRLGSLSASRDWGFAGDYVRAMHLMLTQDEPDDFIIGTGVSHTVEELVDLAFQVVGLEWRRYVVTDASFIRPADVDGLRADPSRACTKLGWKPTVKFDHLVAMMVESDLALLTNYPDDQI
jgi:GDPmannose 4,6-dehydratase